MAYLHKGQPSAVTKPKAGAVAKFGSRKPLPSLPIAVSLHRAKVMGKIPWQVRRDESVFQLTKRVSRAIELEDAMALMRDPELRKGYIRLISQALTEPGWVAK